MASSLFGPQQPSIQMSNNLQNIKELMAIAKTKSPQEMMAILNQNPNMQAVNSFINQYGDTRSAFYALAKQRGIDPNQILNLLK